MTRKTVIVTGASRGKKKKHNPSRSKEILTCWSGIGHAIAKKLLSENANLVILARNENALKELENESPKRVRVLAGDMIEHDLPQKAVELAIDAFGHLDAVIINHGTMDPVAKIVDSDIRDWWKLFDVNFFSAVAFVSVSGLDGAFS